MELTTDQLRDWWEGAGPYHNNDDPILTLLTRGNKNMHYDNAPKEGDEERLRSGCEKYWTPDPSLVSKIQRSSGLSLDYVDHATVTRMLIDIDPFWKWEPMGTDLNGSPIIDCDDNGNPRAIWIRMTVAGRTIPAVGTIERPGAKGYGDTLKELIGDAIRNGALRFGVCGSLWARGKWDEPTSVAPVVSDKARKTSDALKTLSADDKAALKGYLQLGEKAALKDVVLAVMNAGYDPDEMDINAFLKECGA